MLLAIRKKLTILYTVLFGLCLLSFAGLIYGKILRDTYTSRTEDILMVVGGILAVILVAAVIGFWLSGKITFSFEQSMMKQNQFLVDASHEIRTPLSIVYSAIEAIESDEDNVLSPFSREIIQDAKSESLRVKEMINDVLTLVRADTGGIKLKKGNIDIGPVVQQVIEVLQYGADQKQISIKTEIDCPITIYADRARIYQLIFILTDHAIKSSLPGTEVAVQIEYLLDTASIKIAVSDHGPEIPADLREKAFQPFFWIGEACVRDTVGTGLSLSVAQWIVTAHLGKIRIECDSNRRNQFIAQIPAKKN